MKYMVKIILLVLLTTFSYAQDCCDSEQSAIDECVGVGCYIPQCTENCDWEPMQCWGSTGYCWCVDSEGVEIEGTSRPSWQGFPECEESMLGDINNDGAVDVLDAIYAVNLVLEGEYNNIVDMNYDGIVNVLDIIEIIYIIIN